MEKQVLNIVLRFIKKYWYWVLIAFLGLGGISWAWGKITRQHKLLKAAQERISWQTTQIQSKDLKVKQLENAVLIEREKQKDRGSAARIQALKDKNKGLREKQVKVDQQTKKKQAGVKKMSLEELNKQINGE